MSLDTIVRQASARELPRQLSASAGPDRVAGSAPPPPTPEVGPANPRLRMDRDLGVLVIEFRDSAGEVSVSIPTPRELEAYRANIMYGIDLPSYISPNFQSARDLLKSAPAIPSVDEAPVPSSGRLTWESSRVSWDSEGMGLNRVA